jgi:phage gpG-like protein
MRAPVQIRVDKLPAARALFEKVREFGADPTGLLDIWGALLEASTRRRFDTGTAPGGVPWPPSIRAKLQGGKTLVDKGNLEGSIRYAVRPNELEVGIDGVGASSKFAYVHQFGAHIVPKEAKALRFPLPGGGFAVVSSVDIPARPFLGIDEDDKLDMKETGGEYLRSLIDGGP